MRIERMRIALPARFRSDAAGTARVIAEAVAGQVSGQAEPPARFSVALDGGGRSSPLLATAAGDAAARVTGGRPCR
ncbi:MAG: hypothetical protein K0R83_1885 [Caulobacter sp.]|jgi:hypothetical protein|nr:hypothetical protein [Caulobacter sp.]